MGSDWAGALTFGTSNVLLDPESVYGRKPKVPPLKPIDIGAEAGKAIANNKLNLPGAEELVSKTNQFSRDEITKMLNSQMDYSGIAASISGNLAAEAKGQIPKDVADAIRQRDAGSAVAGGFGGSGAGGNLTARDLGLTSLDLTSKATTSMEGWLKTVSSLYEPHMMDVTSMFISPAQQLASDRTERDDAFAHDWMVEQIKAMPDPSATGMVNTAMNLISAVRGSGAQAQIGPQQSPQYGTQTGTGSGGGGNPAYQGSQFDYGYGPTAPTTNINFGGGGGGAETMLDTSAAADFSGMA